MTKANAVENPNTFARVLSAYRTRGEREAVVEKCKEAESAAKQKRDDQRDKIVELMEEIEDKGSPTAADEKELMQLESKHYDLTAKWVNKSRALNSARHEFNQADKVFWSVMDAANQGDNMFELSAVEMGLDSFDKIPLTELTTNNKPLTELAGALHSVEAVTTIADWYHFKKERNGIKAMKGSGVADEDIKALSDLVDRYADVAAMTDPGLFGAVPKDTKPARKPVTKKRTTKKKVAQKKQARSKKKTTRKKAGTGNKKTPGLKLVR